MRHSIEKKSIAEREAISVHTGTLELLLPVIKPFDGKVVNKRMIDALKAVGIHVGWGVDYAGRKEMTLHHGYSQLAGEYAEYKRTITVPLILDDNGRLSYDDTVEEITKLIARLQVDYMNYAYEQVEQDSTIAAIKELLETAGRLRDGERNPHAREELSQLLRRGY